MTKRIRCGGRGHERGFTALEAMISVAVMSLLILIVATMFQTSNKVTRKALGQGDSQQSARVAIDLIGKDLRSLGFNLDIGTGQRGLVYASPWDMIFNANVTPNADDFMNPGFPLAMNTAMAPAGVPAGAPLYTPTDTFTNGAETIRYTLDSNGDGAIDANDQGDDQEEATPNPRDFVLLKEIYGARADGTNGGVGEPVAVVRGPIADADGTVATPLFQYWLDADDDVTTPETLWGDGNADGTLSQAEIGALTPIPAAALALVTRAIVTVTAEDGSPDGTGDYRTRSVTTSVAFRNQIRRTGVITGIVYQDDDADGTHDISSEAPIPNVTVRLSTGATFKTDANGRYVFEVAQGAYTVTEFDPAGYVSTTTNAVAITVSSGSTNRINFGDRPGSGVGTILGGVYDDLNQNGMYDDEPGLSDVVITLHTGQSDTTDAYGQFSFSVPVGTYTVVEADPPGYGSTTPNAVDAILATDGGTAHAYFGDTVSAASGTIRGTVFLDLDRDGLLGGAESGVADVPVVVVGADSTVTDGNGRFSFTVPAGLWNVFEYDLPGYSSSTPNLANGILVMADSSVTVDFGDIYDSSLNFTVVTVGTTDRALSIASTDLNEDNKGDSDIILGTQITAGSNNLHGWHNKRHNSGTGIAALFEASPSFSRAAGAPIPAMLLDDFNGDGVDDVLAGLDTNVGNNLQVWITITSGGSKGTFASSPTQQFATTSGSSVTTIEKVQWPGWTNPLYLVGTITATGTGRVEVWVDSGGGYLAHASSSDILSDDIGALGTVTSIATGDFDADGYPDVAIGQDHGSYLGRVSLFRADPTQDWTWTPKGHLSASGAVLSLKAVDMREDGDADIDLIVGTSVALGAGYIELWNNDLGEFGTADTSGFGGRIVSDWLDAGGEVLSMDIEHLDPDVFPDVVAGLRTAAYSGALNIYRTTGFLPSSGTEWSNTSSGEVVTLTVDDFNIDGRTDIAVGTRTASSTGELVIYFGQ